MENSNLDTRLKQPYLGEKGLIVFIAFLGAFIPLSTDAYLPALPQMVTHLNTTTGMVNMTLVMFFAFYAVGILFWGPLSDKYGRKPILILGLSLYTGASLLCIGADNIYMLIFFRILQSIGCGAATAVSTAIIKDSYEGGRRVKILAIVQTMSTTSPIVSPVIGAFILQWTSWRGVFVLFGLIGAASLIGSMLLRETIRERSQGHIFKAVGRLGVVARNKSLVSLLFMFTLLNIPFMGFITASSFIYINGFGVSERAYSYFFAGNAVFLLLGPMLYLRLARHFSYRKIIAAAYVVISISGVLVMTIGTKNPWIFFALLIPASLTGNMIGPPRMSLMLEQVQGDTGSAVSLIGSTMMIVGSIGMLVMPMVPEHGVVVLGGGYLLAGGISGFLWKVLSQKPYIRHFE